MFWFKTETIAAAVVNAAMLREGDPLGPADFMPADREAAAHSEEDAKRQLVCRMMRNHLRNR